MTMRTKPELLVAFALLVALGGAHDAHATATFDASAFISLTIMDISSPDLVRITADPRDDALFENSGSGATGSARAFASIRGNPDDLDVGDGSTNSASVDAVATSPPRQEAAAEAFTDTLFSLVNTSDALGVDVTFTLTFSYFGAVRADDNLSEFGFAGVDLFVATSTTPLLDVSVRADTLMSPEPFGDEGIFDFTIDLPASAVDDILVVADAFGDATSESTGVVPGVPEPSALWLVFCGALGVGAAKRRRALPRLL